MCVCVCVSPLSYSVCVHCILFCVCVCVCVYSWMCMVKAHLTAIKPFCRKHFVLNLFFSLFRFTSAGILKCVASGAVVNVRACECVCVCGGIIDGFFLPMCNHFFLHRVLNWSLFSCLWDNDVWVYGGDCLCVQNIAFTHQKGNFFLKASCFFLLM